MSPYQYTRIIREELERACSREGIKAHFADYRPFYDEATRRSREGGMYRQNYCGCRFSDAEAAAEREERRAARRAAREAELAAHADERAAAEAERARTRAEAGLRRQAGQKARHLEGPARAAVSRFTPLAWKMTGSVVLKSREGS